MSRPRCIRNERGGVLALVAIGMPVLLVMAALVVDVGDWFTHKRQLQNRADAGALAAGVEYRTKIEACLGSDAAARSAAALAVATAALKYAGDPGVAGAVNTEVANQTKLDVIVNSPQYTAGTSYSDGAPGDTADPCYFHATGDDISAPGHWVDVKVKERDLSSLFGAFGLSLSRNIARARVDIRPAISDNRFVPLAVPEQKIEKAQVRYYNHCTNPPTLLAKTHLSQLKPAYQTVSGTTLWGPAVNGSESDPNATVDPSAITLNVPAKVGCTQDYVPIGVEVRVSGRIDLDIDSDASTACSTLLAGRFTDCWSRISEIRDWKSNPGVARPAIKAVTLAGGTCSPDAYFSRTVSCNAAVSVDVDFGSRSGTYVVEAEGDSLNPPGGGGGNGVWTTTGTIGVGAGSGANTIDVTLRWGCNAQGRSCAGSSGERVHRTFAATDSNAGTVDVVRTAGASQSAGGAVPAPLDNIAAPDLIPTTLTVYPTIGLRSAIVVGQHRILRQGGPQANQSLDCEPGGGQGHDFQMFLNGCNPWYGPNSFTDGLWWNTATRECPRQNVIFNQPNSAADWWQCVPAAPGFSASVIADGIAAATGNCTDIQNNSCRRTACVHPNFYQAWKAGTSTDEARIIKLFIVPYGAFKGVNAQDGLPISTFAAFYVTGWGANGNANADPCTTDPDGAGPGEADEVVNAGEIVGYFIKFVDYGGPIDPLATCTLADLRQCRAVLVR